MLRAVSFLPFPIIWLVGTAAGAVLSVVPSKLKQIARTNVRLCFPELTEREQARLVNRHFRMVGVSILSYGVGWWGSPRRLRRLVRMVHREHYDNALVSGRPIILFTPHFLALDVCGITLSSERPMITMYRESRNRLLDRMLKRRARFGAVLFERKSNLRSMIRYLREGRPFYYLPDQDPGGADAVFVPFFGVQAGTVTAFSRIAAMTGAIVIPCYNRILPRGRGFEVRFEAPLVGYPSGDPVRDALRMNEELEKEVRRFPEQYLWSYRRFKTRPSGTPSLY